MRKYALFIAFFAITITCNAQDIVGDWIRTTGCPNGSKMTQIFRSDGTGEVTIPDCNRSCAPFEYTMTFNWSISGNTLTLEYLTVSPYCGVKQNAPGTFDMNFEASSDKLRIVGDHYRRM